jgi:hypothetical protein
LEVREVAREHVPEDITEVEMAILVHGTLVVVVALVMYALLLMV